MPLCLQVHYGGPFCKLLWKCENVSLHTLFTSKHLHILILSLLKYLSSRLIVSPQNPKLYHFQITSLYQAYSLLSKPLHFKSLHFQLLHLKILSLPNHLTAKLLHLQILNLTCSLRTSHISNHFPTLLIVTALRENSKPQLVLNYSM